MSLLDKEPVKRVESFLSKFKSNLNIIALDTSAKTALEAASSLSCDVGAIVKILNIKDASMASAEEVKSVTGFTIGGVAPIAHLNKLDVFIDNSLERFEHLYAAAGHPKCVFKINFKDLLKITNGSIREIAE